MKKPLMLTSLLAFLYGCTSNTADTSHNATTTQTNDTATYQQPDDSAKLTTKQVLQQIDTDLLLIASGTEPGWILQIYTDKFIFIAQYGQDTLQEPFSANIQQFPIQYKSQTLSFQLEKKNCTAISGETMPLTATIEYKGNKWTGCGKLLP